MTEAEQFALIDAQPQNTILLFATAGSADRYAARVAARGGVGILIRVVDTRTGSGIVAQWRDPIPLEEKARRFDEAAWLLEEALAGRVPVPVPGEVHDITRDVEAQRTAHATAGPSE